MNTFSPILTPTNGPAATLPVLKEGHGGDARSFPTPTRRKICILSLDGGGIKGILPAAVLCHLEERLQEKTRNDDARLCDYFDFFAGASTGGILVSTYLIPDPHRPGRPRLSARRTLDLYRKEGHKIFERPLRRKWRSLLGLMNEKYSAEALTRVLRTFLGETAYPERPAPPLPDPGLRHHPAAPDKNVRASIGPAGFRKVKYLLSPPCRPLCYKRPHDRRRRKRPRLLLLH